MILLFQIPQKEDEGGEAVWHQGASSFVHLILSVLVLLNRKKKSCGSSLSSRIENNKRRFCYYFIYRKKERNGKETRALLLEELLDSAKFWWNVWHARHEIKESFLWTSIGRCCCFCCCGGGSVSPPIHSIPQDGPWRKKPTTRVTSRVENPFLLLPSPLCRVSSMMQPIKQQQQHTHSSRSSAAHLLTTNKQPRKEWGSLIDKGTLSSQQQCVDMSVTACMCVIIINSNYHTHTHLTHYESSSLLHTHTQCFK